MHINFKELVELVATKETDIKKKDVEAIVRATIEATKDALKEGKEIRLNGFGTLRVGENKARVGNNPKTKEKITIPAKKTVKFKVSKPFKELLNK